MKELYITANVMFLGTAILAIFEPLYLWELGFSLQKILLFWAVVYGAYLVLLPLGAKIVSRIGYEPGMMWGSVFMVGYLASLYAIVWNPIFFWIAPIVYAIQKMFYWPSYHGDFIHYMSRKEEGEEVGDIEVIGIFVTIISPIFGGVIVEFLGFAWLFAVASILIIGANFWTLRTPENFTPQYFDYAYPWKRLFARKSWRNFIAYLGYGEELVHLSIWPIFIFVVVKDYFDAGMVAAVASLVTAFITFYIGKLVDHKHRYDVLRIGTVLYALSWFLRIFVATGPHVFVADSLARTAKKVTVVPLSVITYDHARNHTPMHTVVFFEFSLIVGKVFAALLMFVFLFAFEGFTPIFIIAGLMTLLYALLK